MESSLPQWVYGLEIQPELYSQWCIEAGDKSVLHWCIENQKIDEETYLAWAQKAYNVPLLQKEFFQTAALVPELETWMAQLPTTVIPVLMWENVLYLCCLDPSTVPAGGDSPRFQPLLGSWIQASRFRNPVAETDKTGTYNPDTLNQLDFGAIALTAPAVAESPAAVVKKTTQPPPPKDAEIKIDCELNLADLKIQTSEDVKPVVPASAPEVNSATTEINLTVEKLPDIPDSQLPVAARIKVQAERSKIQPAELPDGVPMASEEEITRSGAPEPTVIMSLASKIPHVPGITTGYQVPGKIKPSAQGPSTQPPRAPTIESPGNSILKKPVRLNDFSSNTQVGPWTGAPINLSATPAIKDSRLVERLEQTPQFILPQFRLWFDQTMILIVDGSSLRPWRWDETWRLSGKDITSVDLENPSAFRVVLRSKHAYHGRVAPGKEQNDFYQNWNGGMKPGHVTIAPMYQNDMLVGVILGATTLEKGMNVPLDECEALARLMSIFFARNTIPNQAAAA